MTAGHSLSLGDAVIEPARKRQRMTRSRGTIEHKAQLTRKEASAEAARKREAKKREREYAAPKPQMPTPHKHS